MQNSTNYKTIDRKKYAVVMLILLSIVAVGVWLSLDFLKEYIVQIEELADTEPLEAAAASKQLIRTLAVLSGIILSSFAILIIRHGLTGLRTASMPPIGSWILGGQRTWTGGSAVRLAKFAITVGALLGFLAVASSWILWKLGDTIADQLSNGSYIRDLEMDEFAINYERISQSFKLRGTGSLLVTECDYYCL